jgi:subtilisin family serine protease
MISRVFRTLTFLAICLAVASPLHARSTAAERDDGAARYIVVLEQASLAEWFAAGGSKFAARPRAEAGNGQLGVTGRPKLDTRSTAALAYRTELEADFDQFKSRARAEMGRELEVLRRYTNVLNGFAAYMSPEEAHTLEQLPGVRFVERDSIQKLQTDAGPQWLGADDVWTGVGGLPASKGEGIIVGVIDSGINWEHDSFEDPGEGLTPLPGGPYDHRNPLDGYLGLCDQPGVQCNDKLIGVYDFVEDDPDTPEEEENTNGFDNDGHGSHVASIAVGNSDTVTVFNETVTISGVAPNANLVSYRVCYIGDPGDPSDDGCQTSAILDAIDQAVDDGVDVLNYSIGTGAFSPWFGETTPQAFLGAFDAGIFVVTSAGNTGPLAATVGSPANAPWISAAGNATHNRIFGNQVLGLSGGDTQPPGTITGASLTGGSGVLPIVHARDYGNALCGEGEPELQSTCEGNSGSSNPFPPGTFNGEIVVCDRGTYGRVEKGRNLELAGAGGYILANVDSQGNSIVADEHCLPSTHVTDADGDKLRDWLASGSDHFGQIGPVSLRRADQLGDLLNSSSSRGPGLPPVEDVLKPNLIAPGTEILGAFAKEGNDANQYAFLTGTSMASPHVAGAAALLLSVNRNWTVSMVSSALETTATTELARDSSGEAATPFEAGAGRPRLADAAQAGLYLNETRSGFQAANPGAGGDPRTLNLPGLVDTRCIEVCTFTRTVTSMTTQNTWTATAAGFPAGVVVDISPSMFTLANGVAQPLTIEVAPASAELIGQWIYGTIELTAPGAPIQRLTVAVFASGGDLPEEVVITSDRDSGYFDYEGYGLVGLPDATLTSGGLVRPQTDTSALAEDPTPDDPFDGGPGTFTVLHDVPEGTLWLHAETLASTAEDLDLFVGRDEDGDGRAQADEQLCESISSDDLENCDLFTPPPGTYWIVVQNWAGSGRLSDRATLVSAVVTEEEASLSATTQGIVPPGDDFTVRGSWSNVDAVPGEELFGAVGIGTDRDHPNNVGVVPVRFVRSAIAEPDTFPLMNGQTHKLAIVANSQHRKIFIDVPPGADSLTIQARGLTLEQNDGLTLELKGMGFGQALSAAPEAVNARAGEPVASDTGSGGQGPSVTISGEQLRSGRWYAVLINRSDSPASVAIRADMTFSGEPIPIWGGLWYPAFTRPLINQGYEYTTGGASRAFVWYSYTEDKQAAWYIAFAANVPGNTWVAPLLRYTNDGEKQQGVHVGHVSITMLDEKDAIFTWTLFGESGSDRTGPLSSNTCPRIGGVPRSLIGLWSRAIAGLGGASVLYDANAHFEVHYLYDRFGNPRWLGAATPEGNTLLLNQYSGFCPTCEDSGTAFETVGLLTHDFDSSNSGSWVLDYVMAAPLMGEAQRTDEVSKFLDELDCQ